MRYNAENYAVFYQQFHLHQLCTLYSGSFEKENEVEIENGNENKIEDRTSFEMRSRPQTEDI